MQCKFNCSSQSIASRVRWSIYLVRIREEWRPASNPDQLRPDTDYIEMGNGNSVILNQAKFQVLQRFEMDTLPQVSPATAPAPNQQTGDLGHTYKSLQFFLSLRQSINSQASVTSSADQAQTWRNITEGDFPFNERLYWFVYFTTSSGQAPATTDRPFMNVSFKFTCSCL